MPDWGKVVFPQSVGRPLADLLPGASKGALALLNQLVR